MNRILGIDLGTVRIGLAMSDELGWMAHPWQTLARSPQSITEITRLALEKKVTTIVVGLPRNMNGTYGPASEQCSNFAQELQKKTEAKVILWDERLTTAAAARSLHEAGRSSKQQRSIIDQVAAQQILQDWMDSQKSNT
ncbi:MAG: Holliday junction resolvase RuvX [Verrucomicrobia bacterium]|jgi:putative Holliday junction resolvase|nr:MAG: Holliday junction resolvase RuvX [Verrucomicrobiota bacterium]MDH4469921.1 Holliday junction resolvase RuvX [Verrucomicrobiae bacterium]